MRPGGSRAVLLAAFLGSSCAWPGEAYVAADADTYAVIAPAHRRYVDADAQLSDEQKASRRALLDSWALRIREARK